MSLLPYAFTIAMRFSRGRRRGGMISLISFVSTAGIALGVAVLIIGLSAMNGFERELNQRILSVVPHGEIEAVNPPFSNWRQALKKVEQTPGVIAAAPYIAFTGLLEYGEKLQAVQVKGVDPVQEQKISSLPDFVLKNGWQNFAPGKQQIIIGSGVAASLGVQPGDWLTILIPSDSPAEQLLQPQRVRLQVSAILQLNGQLDHALALIPLQDAQGYLLADEQGAQPAEENISGIAVKMVDPFAAQQVIRAAGEATATYVSIRSWIGTYGYMYRDIQMIRTIMYLAMILVISVASFNIVSTLVMAVQDKSRDIAILRTLGAKDGLIRTIFICYGLLSGLTGSTLGVIAGCLISLKLTQIIKWVETMTGHHLLSGDIYFIDFLPTELDWLDVLIVLATALILCLLASWYPARRASHINPARVLSGQ